MSYLLSRCASRPTFGVFGSAGLRSVDGDTQFMGGRCQAPIERDEDRIEPPGNSEMQGVRGSQPQIEAPDINVGEPGIACPDINRQAHRRTPSVEVRQTRSASASVSRAMRTRRDRADATSAAAKSLISNSWRSAPR